jgi:hypothetical protein
MTDKQKLDRLKDKYRNPSEVYSYDDYFTKNDLEWLIDKTEQSEEHIKNLITVMNGLYETIEHLKFDVKHTDKQWKREGALAEQFESALKYIDQAIYTERCAINHMDNSEY